MTPTEPYQAGYIRQALYLTDSDPIPFMSWQENSLIRAEAALADDDEGAALAFINEARGSLPDLEAADLDVLIDQRDKLLFTQGARLVDTAPVRPLAPRSGHVAVPADHAERAQLEPEHLIGRPSARDPGAGGG